MSGFSRFRCLPIEESNISSKILPFLPRFVAYHLEGQIFLSLMVVFSQKSQQRIVRGNVESGELYPRFLRKNVRCQVKESFLKLRLSFCQSRCLPFREIFLKKCKKQPCSAATT